MQIRAEKVWNKQITQQEVLVKRLEDMANKYKLELEVGTLLEDYLKEKEYARKVRRGEIID